MPRDRKLSDYSCRPRRHSDPLRPSRTLSVGLVHLFDMDTTTLFQHETLGREDHLDEGTAAGSHPFPVTVRWSPEEDQSFGGASGSMPSWK